MCVVQGKLSLCGHYKTNCAMCSGLRLSAMQMLHVPSPVHGADLDCACHNNTTVLVLLHCQAGTARAGAQKVFDDLTVYFYHRYVHLLSRTAQDVLIDERLMATSPLQGCSLHVAGGRQNGQDRARQTPLAPA